MLALSGAIAGIGYVFGILMLCFAAANLTIGLYCFRSLILSYQGATIYSTLVEYVIGKVLCFVIVRKHQML
jgi:amino acid permease